MNYNEDLCDQAKNLRRNTLRANAALIQKREEVDLERDLAGDRREDLAFGDLLKNSHQNKNKETELKNAEI